MKALQEYSIPFSGLKNGSHHFQYEVNDAFFEEFGTDDLRNASIDLQVELLKDERMLQWVFDFNGTATVDCDRCGQELELEIVGNNRLIVKFGADAFEQTDEIVVIPESDSAMDIAQFVYEFITLSIPQRRAHEEGQCDQAALDRLEALEPAEREEEEDEVDPRWAALKDLKTKN